MADDGLIIFHCADLPRSSEIAASEDQTNPCAKATWVACVLLSFETCLAPSASTSGRSCSSSKRPKGHSSNRFRSSALGAFYHESRPHSTNPLILFLTITSHRVVSALYRSQACTVTLAFCLRRLCLRRAAAAARFARAKMTGAGVHIVFYLNVFLLTGVALRHFFKRLSSFVPYIHVLLMLIGVLLGVAARPVVSLVLEAGSGAAGAGDSSRARSPRAAAASPPPEAAPAARPAPLAVPAGRSQAPASISTR